MTAKGVQSEPGRMVPARPLAIEEPSPARPERREAGLVEALIAATAPGRPETRASLDGFLRQSSPAAALHQWLAFSGATRPASKDDLVRMLNRDVSFLDGLLSRQVNAILHHPRLQRLEASWRGLRYLVEQVEETDRIKIRVLSVGWRELARDLERAIEFDQSQLFRKVYGDEFDMPGGEPFGMLVGDYEIHPRPSAAHPVDDVGVLGSIAQVAAAAFAPLVASAHPSMFGLDDFAGLEQPLGLTKTFDQLEYLKWNAFRETEDSRFVGLALPRVLMRLPYEDDGSRTDGFAFHEDVAGRDARAYLWGSAAYAFAAVVIRAIAQSGWPAGIRGVQRDAEGGGLVSGLPVHCFSTDAHGVAPKCSTEVAITDRQEQELSDLGFIPLCACAGTEFSAFYGNQSVQKPRKYDEAAATMNARISAMLQYMLCVSRFAHYLKVMVRDKIGTFTEAGECEKYLQDWLRNYVTADSDASAQVKARYPLREANVQVREHPDKPGSYLCVAHLWPHFELDELTTTIRLTTQLRPGRPG